MKKRLVVTTLSIIMLLAFFTASAYAENITKFLTAYYTDIKITLDGEELLMEDINGNQVEAFIVDGTSYLPVRAVAGALNLDVEWDNNNNTITLTSQQEQGRKDACINAINQLNTLEVKAVNRYHDATTLYAAVEKIKSSSDREELAKIIQNNYQWLVEAYAAWDEIDISGMDRDLRDYGIYDLAGWDKSITMQAIHVSYLTFISSINIAMNNMITYLSNPSNSNYNNLTTSIDKMNLEFGHAKSPLITTINALLDVLINLSI